MSKQTIVRVTESRYHKGTFTIMLSCGCDYFRGEGNPTIGDKANCPRCPVSVAAPSRHGYPGQEYWHKHNPNIRRAEENWERKKV